MSKRDARMMPPASRVRPGDALAGVLLAGALLLGSPSPAPAQPAPRPAPAPADAGKGAPKGPAPATTTPAPPPAAPSIAYRREDAARTPPLQPDRPVSLRLNRNQSAFFRIAPEAGPAFTATTRNLAQGTDTVLEFLDAQGRTLGEDDDGGDQDLSSRLESGSPRPAFLRAGTVDGAGGRFELVLTRDADPGPLPFATSAAEAAQFPLPAPGQPLHIRLRRGQTGFLALPAERTGLVARTRDLRRGTDTTLALLDAGGRVIAEDDDGGGDLASLLPLDEGGGSPTVLRLGTADGGSAEFDLVIEREAPAGPPDFPTSLLEAATSPPIAPGTRHLRLGRRQVAVFALPPEGAQDLVFRTEKLGEGVDTNLALLDANGNVLLEDDDGGGNLASRLAVGDAPRAPAFLRVNLIDGRGEFDLVTAREAVAPAADVAATIEEARGKPAPEIGRSIRLRLRNGQVAVLPLPDSDAPLLALTHSLQGATDTVLELLDAQGNVLAEDDDGAGGLASRLVIPAQPRPAFLRVKTVDAGTGTFEVVLIRPAG
ncbi:hypothetical protein LPC08_09255 [Roseomonas sp. OT10]|uniref:hypothetical protein n=1 Tax=Roseomonas cutis TaxID=2897332 RepID=UPI001E5892FE|nr:hypothetical protein [Roseomonas sp. OT10]UFN50777.1 hypothetical protein LPC08_09255 [Roseomonas sp. OT10]